MSDIFGVGGIISGVIGGVSSILNLIKDIGVKLIEIGKEVLMWIVNTLITNPEAGVTLLAIILYLLSPVTL